MIYKLISPFGPVSYAWDGKRCSHIWLDEQPHALPHGDDPVAQCLQSYFSKQRAALPPLTEAKKTFQNRLRLALLGIPQGEVLTYGQLAGQLHTSPRGLGQALGANPFPIIIPCHRVISARGLGGYAYGCTWKQELLDFER